MTDSEISWADHCDGCTRQVRSARLETDGGAGVYLCRACWWEEMVWRQARNRYVAHPFPILPFPKGYGPWRSST